MSKKTSIRQRYEAERVMANYRELMEALPYMNEEECKAALDFEAARPVADRRKEFIMRLHRRYCKLRQEREYEEYFT